VSAGKGGRKQNEEKFPCQRLEGCREEDHATACPSSSELGQQTQSLPS